MTAALPLLVTGATGFVGRHLVANLLAGGVRPGDLRLLVRDRDRAVRLGLPADSLWDGDLFDPARLEPAAAGVGSVVHLAGTLRGWRARQFVTGNADTTRNLVGALLRGAPGARLVHVSSLSAAGPSADGTGSDAPPDRCAPCSHYGRAKLAAEREVAAAGDRLRWLVLRPPVVYGPADDATRLLFRQARRPLAAVPWRPRPLSLIHVDDLIAVLRLALASSVSGRFVPVEGPDRADTSGLIRAIATALGRRVRLLPVPLALARVAGFCADGYAALLRRASFFNADKVREIAARGWVADPTSARELLGFAPRVRLPDGLAAVARNASGLP